MRSHSDSENFVRNFGGLLLLSFFVAAGGGGLFALLIGSFGRVNHNEHVTCFCSGFFRPRRVIRTARLVSLGRLGSAFRFGLAPLCFGGLRLAIVALEREVLNVDDLGLRKIISKSLVHRYEF